MRLTLVIMFLTFVSSTLAQSARFSNLDFLVETALRNNASIASTKIRIQAANAQVSGAGALPDPRVNLGIFAQEVETRVGPQKWKFGFSQKFPGRGKLSTSVRISQKKVSELEALLRAKEASLRKQVTQAFLEYHYLARATVVTRDSLRLLGGLEKVALATYRAGRGSHSSVIKLQIEEGRLRDRLRTLQERRSSQSANLESLLNAETPTPLPWPEELLTEAPLPSDELLVKTLKANNPQLLVLRRKIETARAINRQTHLAKRPDLTLGLEYIGTDEAAMAGVRDSGKDPIIAKVAWNLPVRTSRYKAAQKSTELGVAAIEKELEQRSRQLAATLKTAAFRVKDSRSKIKLYKETLIPKAEQALTVGKRSFATGGRDFLDVIDTERMLLEFQLSLERARVDEALARAEVIELIGRVPARGAKQ